MQVKDLLLVSLIVTITAHQTRAMALDCKYVCMFKHERRSDTKNNCDCQPGLLDLILFKVPSHLLILNCLKYDEIVFLECAS